MSQPSTPQSSSIGLNPGDTLAGKYHIERVVGRGCMGVVMSARHVHLDQRVAIKFMLPEIATQAEHVGRFVREARAAAKIRNEHVARVMDVDVLPGGLPYIVMEFLEGQDLGAVLEHHGPLPVMQVVDYILEACDALAEAHALGIVHRDFKPANVFLANRSDGKKVTKILDFGISKMKAADMQMTSTVALMGSPAYMSPEQMMSSRDVDPRTDIWAVGVSMYQLLTGVLPFVGTTVPEVCARVLNLDPTPLRSLRPDIPPALEKVVLHCLVKNRDQRFQSIRELVAALSHFSSTSSSPGSHPLQGPTGSYPGMGTSMPSPAERSDATLPVWGGTVNGERSRKTSRRWTILALTAVGAAAVVVAFLALRGKVTEQRVDVTPALAPPVNSSPPAPEPTPKAASDNTGAVPVPEPIDNVGAAAGGPSIEDDLARALAAPRPRDRYLSPSSDTSGHRPLRPPARPKPPKSAPPGSEDLFSEPK